MNSIPLNFFFYLMVTSLGLYFLTKSRFTIVGNRTIDIGKLIATFIFAYLSIWISNDNLLTINTWYIQSYNSTSGNFTLTSTTTAITTPYIHLITLIHIGLAFVSILAFISQALPKGDSE
jgi:hypothetical protein